MVAPRVQVGNDKQQMVANQVSVRLEAEKSYLQSCVAHLIMSIVMALTIVGWFGLVVAGKLDGSYIALADDPSTSRQLALANSQVLLIMTSIGCWSFGNMSMVLTHLYLMCVYGIYYTVVLIHPYAGFLCVLNVVTAVNHAIKLRQRNALPMPLQVQYANNAA